MSAFDNTAANVVIPEVWDTEVLQARYAKAAIMPRVLNKSQKVADYGDIVHIPIKPRFTGVTVGTDGSFTTEAPTLTEAQVAVDTWKAVAIEVPDKTSKQSIVTLETELPSQFGDRLAEFYDQALANLYGNLTGGTPVGTKAAPTAFIRDAALTSVLGLRANNIPLEDLSWVLPPHAFYLGWLTQEITTAAYATGLPKSVLSTNARGPILNIPAFESNNLAGSTLNPDATITGGIAGMLIHKESFAIAMQINNKYERTRMTPNKFLSTLVVAHNLFGVITVRADHGSVLYIKNS